jgi:hypothetical protein
MFTTRRLELSKDRVVEAVFTEAGVLDSLGVFEEYRYSGSRGSEHYLSLVDALRVRDLLIETLGLPKGYAKLCE